MEITTSSGALRGVREGRLYCFRGVPYAKAERFRPPAEYRWDGVLDCTRFGKKAIQDPKGGGPGTPERDPAEFSEDCLNLNIYTPSLEGSLPVVIYIHGGAFQNGSGQDRAGADMVRGHDFIYVSFNYRLGALGYLYLGGLLGEKYRCTGNLGTLDQLAAIRWVYENIAAFGGDPDQITLIGESAGAKAISALLTRPEMGAYCKRVCLASGGPQCIRDAGTAGKLARRFLERAGLERAEAAADEEAKADLWIRILTDYMYRAYSARLARRLAENGGRVWYYTMEFGSAFHVLDQGIAFERRIDKSALGNATEAQAMALGGTIYESYARFFQRGDPNGADLPVWPELSEREPHRTVWDVPVRVEAVPDGDTLDRFPACVYKL